MALVVETGAGSSTANAYVSVAEVDSYAVDVNNTAWAALTTAQKEAAIIEATFYIDTQFKFLGQKNSYLQALSWPRTGAQDVINQVSFPSTIVPLQVKRTALALAIKAGNGEILLKDFARGGLVSSEAVGPIKISYEAGAPAQTLYLVAGWLNGLVQKAEQYRINIPKPTFSSEQYFRDNQFNNNGNVLNTGGGNA